MEGGDMMTNLTRELAAARIESLHTTAARQRQVQLARAGRQSVPGPSVRGGRRPVPAPVARAAGRGLIARVLALR